MIDHKAKSTSIILRGVFLALSATFMALAVQAPQHFWLGWVSLLPLLQAARVLSPFRAFGAGFFWGGSFLGSSLALGSPIDLSFVSAAILTLGPALYACLGAMLTRRVGFSPYLMALGWVGVELCLRPVGLQHGLLAGTQGDGMLFRVAGNFAGYFLVAFVVAYINASLLCVIHKVAGGSAGVRMVSSCGGLVGRLIALDIPFIPSRALCISQPRAPPSRRQAS